MDLIPSKIEQKISALNDNGKFIYLQDIIQHCLKHMPDLEALPVNTVKDGIGPLLALVKYLVLTHEQTLESHAAIQMEKLERIERENQDRMAEVTALKQKLGLEGLKKSEIEGLHQCLMKTDALMEKLHVSQVNLDRMKNQFQYMALLSRDMEGFDKELAQCRTGLDALEKRLCARLRKNQDQINELRDEINEI